ncbi:unnamed protein product [Pedinophyceae sp. YPF-701]|nr:unnamed protein product [Pedinophyceae sp. YPF-701]
MRASQGRAAGCAGAAAARCGCGVKLNHSTAPSSLAQMRSRTSRRANTRPSAARGNARINASGQPGAEEQRDGSFMFRFDSDQAPAPAAAPDEVAARAAQERRLQNAVDDDDSYDAEEDARAAERTPLGAPRPEAMTRNGQGVLAADGRAEAGEQGPATSGGAREAELGARGAEAVAMEPPAAGLGSGAADAAVEDFAVAEQRRGRGEAAGEGRGPRREDELQGAVRGGSGEREGAAKEGVPGRLGASGADSTGAEGRPETEVDGAAVVAQSSAAAGAGEDLGGAADDDSALPPDSATLFSSEDFASDDEDDVVPGPEPSAQPVASAALSGSRTQGTGRSGIRRIEQRDSRDAITSELTKAFNAYGEHGELAMALELVQSLKKENRVDALRRLRHKPFLRAAARAKDVKAARDFLLLMPSELLDARTYNMALSVCVAAKDLDAASKMVRNMAAEGIKADAYTYTSLITCAARCMDTEAAFRLSIEMKERGVAPTTEVRTALITCCLHEMEVARDRRRRLVLVQRAETCLREVLESGAKPDRVLLNAMVALYARAEDPEKATEMIDQMRRRGVRPDAAAYSALIAAHTRAGHPENALAAYEAAMDAGVRASVAVYSAAVSACRRLDDGPRAVETVRSILGEMHANSVHGDQRMYRVAMDACGAAGDVRAARDVLAAMKEAGVKPREDTRATLMQAYISAGHLRQALRSGWKILERRQGRKKAAPLHMRPFNTLLRAEAERGHLRSVVDLAVACVEVGGKPDRFTFAAVLTACMREREADLGIDVYRAMRARGIAPDVACTSIMLRTCLNRMRGGQSSDHHAGWDPDVGVRLIEALSGGKSPEDLLDSPALPGGLDSPSWSTRALALYRDAMRHGLVPDMRLLERLLPCLTVTHATAASTEGEPTEAGIDLRARSVIEDAVVRGLLPSFPYDSGFHEVDLRRVPPHVAAAYTLFMFQGVRSARVLDGPSGGVGGRGLMGGVGGGAGRVLAHSTFEVTIRTLPFNEDAVGLPLGAMRAAMSEVEDEGQALDVDSMDSSDEEEGFGEEEWEDSPIADASDWAAGDSPGYLSGPEIEKIASTKGSTTGLAVMMMLRKLRVWGEAVAHDGVVFVSHDELLRWCRSSSRRMASQAANSRRQPGMIGANGGFGAQGDPAAALRDQTRDLRNAGGDKAPNADLRSYGIF